MLLPRAPAMACPTTARSVRHGAAPRRGDACSMQILAREIAVAILTDPHPFARVEIAGATRPTRLSWNEMFHRSVVPTTRPTTLSRWYPAECRAFYTSVTRRGIT